MAAHTPLGAEPSDLLAARCARFYLWLALPGLLLLAFLTAPFEASDEPAHFLRANAITEGTLLPLVNRHDIEFGGAQVSTGGLVDTGVKAMVRRYPRQLYRGTPTTWAMLREWGRFRATHRLVYAYHSNTALYPPMLYAGSIAGTAIARAAGLPVLGWLYAARVANVLIGVAIVTWAIRRARDAAPFLLAIAMLPMTLFQMAAASADATLLPLFLAFGVLVARMAMRAPPLLAEEAVLSIILFAICVGKIAYLPFVVLPPLAARWADGRWSPRALFYAGAGLAWAIGWAIWADAIHDKVFTMIPGVAIDPRAQLDGMLAAPVHAIGVFVVSMVTQLPVVLLNLVGSRLGWLDVVMPKPFVLVCLVAAAAALPFAAAPEPRERRTMLLALGLAILCYLVTYLLLYLQYNAVGSTRVEGFNGRYLIPLALVVGAVVPRWRVAPRTMRRMMLAIYGWAGLSVAITAVTVFRHYWAFA